MGGRGRRKEGERQGLRDRQTARHTEADSKGQRHSQKETELDNERARLRFREQKKGRDTDQGLTDYNPRNIHSTLHPI